MMERFQVAILDDGRPIAICDDQSTVNVSAAMIASKIERARCELGRQEEMCRLIAMGEAV